METRRQRDAASGVRQSTERASGVSLAVRLTHPADVQQSCETTYFFSGAFSAAGFAAGAGFAASWVFASAFFSVFAGSAFLAASSARAAKEVARTRAAISFFMVLLLGLGTARAGQAPVVP